MYGGDDPLLCGMVRSGSVWCAVALLSWVRWSNARHSGDDPLL